MSLLSTGLIIAGAYADKVRRTLFAQLKDKVKAGEITPQEIARAAGELNRIVYEVLVHKLKIDKGDVVRIRVNYEVKDGKIEWDYSSLTIEAFKREPDDKVEELIRSSIKEILEQEVIREEKQKIEESGKKVEGREIEKEKTATTTTSAWANNIAEVVVLGELPYGGYVLALKDSNGENLGVTVVEERAGTTVLDTILISDEKAYRAYIKTNIPLSKIGEEPNSVIEELKKASPVAISKDEARRIIEEKLQSLT